MTAPSSDRIYEVDISAALPAVNVGKFYDGPALEMPPASLSVEVAIGGENGFIHAYLVALPDAGSYTNGYSPIFLTGCGTDMPGDDNDEAWGCMSISGRLPWTRYGVVVVPIASAGSFDCTLRHVRFTVDYGLNRSYAGVIRDP